MNLELHDSIAVVFGGAQGIGLEIAREFHREGARVAIVDLDTRRLAQLEQEASWTAGQASFWSCDVTDYEATRGVVADISRRWHAIHHVVCAVGCGSGKFGYPFWNLEPGDWQRVTAVNLMGAVNVAHACAPRLIDSRPASLLFLASVAAQIGSQTDPPYSAAKAGLLNFMQCAAKDFAPHDVRVNALSPGMVQTQLNQSVWAAWNQQQAPRDQRSYEDWAGEKVSKIAPLGRWQTAQDMASMAVFLASPRARNITGQTLNVDGGQVMHS